MIVGIHAVAFDGHGAITCKHCQSQTVFPDDCSVIMVDLGSRLRVVGSNGVVYHDCGRRQVLFWCEVCSVVVQPRRVRRFDARRAGTRGGTYWDATCPACYQPAVAKDMGEISEPLGQHLVS